jgi:uncharacterized protein YcfJ
MNSKVTASVIALAMLGALSGCAIAPTGPSVMVLPGNGKTFDQFKADDAQCRSWATQSIGGPEAGNAASTVAKTLVPAGIGAAAGALLGAAFSHGSGNGAAVGAGVGVVAGGALGANSTNGQAMTMQQRYDHAYVQCMYAQRDKIPGLTVQ